MNVKNYKIKKRHAKDVCRIVGCLGDRKARGLCDNHYRYFRKTGRLKMYGLPPIGYSLTPEAAKKRKRKITKSKRPKKGKCHILENGASCKNDALKAGMCHKHYQYAWRWGLLKKMSRW